MRSVIILKIPQGRLRIGDVIGDSRKCFYLKCDETAVYYASAEVERPCICPRGVILEECELKNEKTKEEIADKLDNNGFYFNDYTYHQLEKFKRNEKIQKVYVIEFEALFCFRHLVEFGKFFGAKETDIVMEMI